ncbi:hypothetical protein NA56DRAFT_710690 [Hyaloscypha hepaticicola]|uniref:Uncharacterized protein n=1 Tax=Hyaloscypha hepaticicola TaxID=2082293 RepID=A0A2J6PKS8_9HELO|nr:hypothetical protein NA56DRAFT_710690 [Hyaloscypha hepaticicola]
MHHMLAALLKKLERYMGFQVEKANIFYKTRERDRSVVGKWAWRYRIVDTAISLPLARYRSAGGDSYVGVDITISPLINYGLGQIHSTLTTWKPLFLVLDSVTGVCLTEEERAIAIHHLERNNAGTISRTFNKAQFFEAFRDFKLYSCTLIILLTGVPSGAIGTFGTIVRV